MRGGGEGRPCSDPLGKNEPRIRSRASSRSVLGACFKTIARWVMVTRLRNLRHGESRLQRSQSHPRPVEDYEYDCGKLWLWR
jgi:hypothetical protein